MRASTSRKLEQTFLFLLPAEHCQEAWVLLCRENTKGSGRRREDRLIDQQPLDQRNKWQRVLSGAEKNVNTKRLSVQTYSKTLERGGLEDRVSWAMVVHSRLHSRKHTPQAHPMPKAKWGTQLPTVSRGTSLPIHPSPDWYSRRLSGGLRLFIHVQGQQVSVVSGRQHQRSLDLCHQE